MEKIKKSISINLPILKIYLDEIKEIYDLLKEYEGFEFLFEDNRIEQFEDLEKIEIEKSSDVNFIIREPYITLNINDGYTHIYSDSNKIISFALVTKLQEALIKCKRRYLNFFRTFWGILIVFVFIFLVCLGIMIVVKLISNNDIITYLIGIISLFSMEILIFRYFDNAKTEIVLKYRKEAPNFLKRNKDNIILSFLSLLLGSLLTITGKLIYDSLLHK